MAIGEIEGIEICLHRLSGNEGLELLHPHRRRLKRGISEFFVCKYVPYHINTNYFGQCKGNPLRFTVFTRHNKIF